MKARLVSIDVVRNADGSASESYFFARIEAGRRIVEHVHFNVPAPAPTRPKSAQAPGRKVKSQAIPKR